MTPNEVLIYLRMEGVIVHLVTHNPADGLTIYLEAHRGQMELVEELMLALPAVESMWRVAPGILHVTRK